MTRDTTHAEKSKQKRIRAVLLNQKGASEEIYSVLVAIFISGVVSWEEDSSLRSLLWSAEDAFSARREAVSIIN